MNNEREIELNNSTIWDISPAFIFILISKSSKWGTYQFGN